MLNRNIDHELESDENIGSLQIQENSNPSNYMFNKQGQNEFSGNSIISNSLEDRLANSPGIMENIQVEVYT